MKFGSMWLAVAGLLGSVAVAQAQDAPAPAPEPAPEPAPAPAPPPPAAAPPELAPPGIPEPVAAPPPPSVSWGAQPGADTTTTPEKPKTPAPYAKTWFTWNQSASTKLLGVGGEYQGMDNAVYSWDFTFTPRYAFINTPKDQAYVNGSLGFQVELTNSDSTVQQNEWQFKDLQLGVGWGHLIYESRDKEYANKPSVGFSMLLPTSKASANEGKFLSTSFTLADQMQVKLAGTKSDWFPNVILLGRANWQHLFSESFNPIHADPSRLRADTTGSTIVSDQLSMSSFNENQLKFTFEYSLAVWKDLSFGNAYAIAVPFKYKYSDTQCITTQTDCAGVGSSRYAVSGNPSYGVPTTTFDLSLSYELLGLGAVNVGYDNEAPQLGEDGKHRNIFYSPNAVFYLELVAYFDSIYDKTKEQLSKKRTASVFPSLYRGGLH